MFQVTHAFFNPRIYSSKQETQKQKRLLVFSQPYSHDTLSYRPKLMWNLRVNEPLFLYCAWTCVIDTAGGGRTTFVIFTLSLSHKQPANTWYWLRLMAFRRQKLSVVLENAVQLCSKRMGRLVVVTKVSLNERFTGVNSMRSKALQCWDVCSDDSLIVIGLQGSERYEAV